MILYNLQNLLYAQSEQLECLRVINSEIKKAFFSNEMQYHLIKPQLIIGFKMSEGGVIDTFIIKKHNFNEIGLNENDVVEFFKRNIHKFSCVKAAYFSKILEKPDFIYIIYDEKFTQH